MKRSAVPITVAVLAAALVGLLVYGVVGRKVNDTLDQAVSSGKKPAAPGRDIRLPPLDGESRATALGDLDGKVVVLNFWASWCVPCRDEAPVLERTWREHGPHRVVVVGADWKDLGSAARRFARRYGMTYPLVRDGHELTRPYGLTGVPETFVIDRRGRIVGAIAGALNQNDEDTRRYDRLLRQALRT